MVARTRVPSPSPKLVDAWRANASGQLARQRGVAASMSARVGTTPPAPSSSRHPRRRWLQQPAFLDIHSPAAVAPYPLPRDEALEDPTRAVVLAQPAIYGRVAWRRLCPDRRLRAGRPSAPCHRRPRRRSAPVAHRTVARVPGALADSRPLSCVIAVVRCRPDRALAARPLRSSIPRPATRSLPGRKQQPFAAYSGGPRSAQSHGYEHSGSTKPRLLLSGGSTSGSPRQTAVALPLPGMEKEERLRRGGRPLYGRGSPHLARKCSCGSPLVRRRLSTPSGP
jgi:hypothetical protein